MSLSGLLRVITDDPELRRALDEADSPASPGGDLIAPPALRPFLVAALAGAGQRGASASAVTEADAPGAAARAVTEADAAGAADEGHSAERARQRGAHRFVLAVTATAREAEDLTAALGSLLPRG